MPRFVAPTSFRSARCAGGSRGGHIVTKDELLERVWPKMVVEEAALHVQVSALRKVLGTNAIATVSG